MPKPDRITVTLDDELGRILPLLIGGDDREKVIKFSQEGICLGKGKAEEDRQDKGGQACPEGGESHPSLPFGQNEEEGEGGWG